jgi:hypothetical protein
MQTFSSRNEKKNNKERDLSEKNNHNLDSCQWREKIKNVKTTRTFLMYPNKASSARRKHKKNQIKKLKLKTNKTTTKKKYIQLAQTDPRREMMLL